MTDRGASADQPAPYAQVLAVKQHTDRSLARLPALELRALRLVRRAAPGLLRSLLVLHVVVAFALGGRLVAVKYLVDAVGEDAPSTLDLLLPVCALLGLSVAVSVVTLVGNERQALMGEQARRYMDGMLLDVAAAAPLGQLERPTFYDELQRAQYGTEAKPLALATGASGLVAGALSLLAVLGALAAVAPVLLPVVAIGFIPLWVTTRRQSRVAHAFEMGFVESERRRQYFAAVLSAREFAKEVRSNGIAAGIRERYDELYTTRLDRLRSLSRARVGASLRALLLSATAASVALFFLIRSVAAGDLSGAVALVAALAVLELGGRLAAITTSAGLVLQSALFLDQFESFVDRAPSRTPPAAVETPAPAPRPAPGGSTLEVLDADFTYPDSDSPAVSGVQVRIEPGELVAVVGPNGSGKTTLALLMTGLLQPTRGSVRIDGMDTVDMTRAALRQRVSALFQDYARYELTLAENVELGDPTCVSDDRVQAVSARVGVDAIAAALPKGYSTPLGRAFFGGHELSLGQWQQVALARTLLKEPSLLVLDEPTAAMDPLREREVFRDVRRQAAGRTIVFISHRFSTVRDADRILVMDRGRLVEDGSHDELVAADGLYRAMFAAQSEPYR